MYYGYYSRNKLPILSDGAIFILLVLYISGPSYGYRILGEVKRISDYGCDMMPTTLYRTLEQFLSQEFINLLGREDEIKVYQITSLGIATLYKQYARIHAQNEILSRFLEKEKTC